MSPSRMADALFPKARLAVLKTLWQIPDGLHLREIARRSGLNKRGLGRELHNLRDAGILRSRRQGSLVTYTFDPGCPIYEELRSIVRKTVGLVDALHEALAEVAGGRIDLAYVYGSCATGGETAASDVDLMIVGDVSLVELSSSLRLVAQNVGREVNPTVYSRAEYQDLLEDPESFVSRVHSGPKLAVIERDL